MRMSINTGKSFDKFQLDVIIKGLKKPRKDRLYLYIVKAM